MHARIQRLPWHVWTSAMYVTLDVYRTSRGCRILMDISPLSRNVYVNVRTSLVPSLRLLRLQALGESGGREREGERESGWGQASGSRPFAVCPSLVPVHACRCMRMRVCRAHTFGYQSGVVSIRASNASLCVYVVRMPTSAIGSMRTYYATHMRDAMHRHASFHRLAYTI
jgi:hypothetical protein